MAKREKPGAKPVKARENRARKPARVVAETKRAVAPPPAAKREGGATKRAATRERLLIVLLRGINVGGNKRMPMAKLCELASKVGCSSVRHYIQSGNLVVLTTLEPAALETRLERAISQHFGFAVDVIARSLDAWRKYAARTPFPDAASARPHLLHLGVTKQPPRPGAVATLAPYAKAGERVELTGDALWIDFPEGVARSKLSPAVLDRALGSTVTARNHRTVQKLLEMALALESSASASPR